MSQRTTFRVQRVPLDWRASRLRACLEQHDPSSSPVIRSLALEVDRRSYTATVDFRSRPLVTQSPKPWDISLGDFGENDSSDNGYITLDDDLLGITTLYLPSDENHKADIIALGSISGCPLDSFEDEASSHVWLRDVLPAQLFDVVTRRPMARVMTYGFQSFIDRDYGPMTFEALGKVFLKNLATLGTPSDAKPTILVGHGVGGLVIKQALVSLSQSQKEADTNILDAIRGVIFLGVPHDGMDIASLGLAPGNGGLSQQLIESLSREGSEVLKQLHSDFMQAFAQKYEIEIFSFYETLETTIVQQDGSLRYGVVVSRASATHCHPCEDDSLQTCAIPRTHAGMARFEPHDPEYDAVRNRLLKLVRRATSDWAYVGS